MPTTRGNRRGGIHTFTSLPIPFPTLTPEDQSQRRKMTPPENREIAIEMPQNPLFTYR